MTWIQNFENTTQKDIGFESFIWMDVLNPSPYGFQTPKKELYNWTVHLHQTKQEENQMPIGKYAPLFSSEEAPQLGIQIMTIWNRATGSVNENSQTHSHKTNKTLVPMVMY